MSEDSEEKDDLMKLELAIIENVQREDLNPVERAKAFKKLADQFGIEVMICHYPTGASKWNPIEHRLFSEISKNWAGKPLRTFQTVINYIQDTVTETGLTIKAFLVDLIFEKGLQYDQKDRENLNLHRYRTCPTWNYTIKPHACSG